MSNYEGALPSVSTSGQAHCPSQVWKPLTVHFDLYAGECGGENIVIKIYEAGERSEEWTMVSLGIGGV